MKVHRAFDFTDTLDDLLTLDLGRHKNSVLVFVRTFFQTSRGPPAEGHRKEAEGGVAEVADVAVETKSELLTGCSDGFEQVVDIFVPQFVEEIIVVFAAVCRSATWSAW